MCRPIAQPLFFFPLILALVLGIPCPGRTAEKPGTPGGETTSKPSAFTPEPREGKLMRPHKSPLSAKVAQLATGNLPTPSAVTAPHKKTKNPADSKKYYQVKEGDTLYSVGVNSGQGHQNLALWNNLPPPYTVKTGQLLKLFDPSAALLGQADSSPKYARDSVQKVSVTATNKPSAATVATLQPSIAPLVNQQPIARKKKTSISDGNKKMLQLSFQWPLRGGISKSFRQSHNQGIDIENTAGNQSVLAAEAGQVVYAGQGLSSLKNLIIIKHNEHYLTAYANDSRLLVNEEQQVKAGQAIAEIEAMVALHFQIRKNGVPVNPLSLLPR
jgi:lipoprotein NlpD